MDNNLFEVEVIQPGRPTGEYKPAPQGRLRLEKILFPDEFRTFDLAVLPKTLNARGENLAVLLLSPISHPPETIVSANILGGYVCETSEPVLLAAVGMGKIRASLVSPSSMDANTDQMIREYLRGFTNGSKPYAWVGRAETEQIIRDASIRYRLAAEETRKQAVNDPAWKPMAMGKRKASYTEAEHYTEAEYAFFEMPNHFQYYVNSYLSNDERILYALRRPAMRSRWKRSFLGGEKLQEGVLILTNQRLLQLVELIPPGSSGVRYGYLAQLGLLERLAGASVDHSHPGSILLKTRWMTAHTPQTIEWEYPEEAISSIDRLVVFLNKFIAESEKSSALRRCARPTFEDTLPDLRDPAANDPGEVALITGRFRRLVFEILQPGETAYAWALWPAWFENRGYPQILLVTDRRLLILLDPARGSPPSFEAALPDLAVLEYVGSIINSYIGVKVSGLDGDRFVQLNFPYTAEGAFSACFQMLRSLMAITPLHQT